MSTPTKKLRLTKEQEALAQRLFSIDKPLFPATLGGCVDAMYRLREERLKLERKVRSLRADEDELREHIFNQFGVAGVEGARGKVASASISRLIVAHVLDWDKVYRHVSNQDEWELLTKRINDAAYRERLEQHEKVPGIEPFEKIGLSLTKRK